MPTIRLVFAVALLAIAACSTPPAPDAPRPEDPSPAQLETLRQAIGEVGKPGFGTLSTWLDSGRIRVEANQVRNERYLATFVKGAPPELILNPIYVSPEPSRFSRLVEILTDAAAPEGPASKRIAVVDS